MNITNVKIKNFRLLKNTIISLSDTTTVIVGKNNTGKTSFSRLFDLFFNRKDGFSFYDFSISCHDEFKLAYEQCLRADIESENNAVEFPAISLEFEIEYANNDNDNWAHIRPLLVSLKDDNKIILECKYEVRDSRALCDALKDRIVDKDDLKTNLVKQLALLVPRHFEKVFYAKDSEGICEKIQPKAISSIMFFGFIGAQRTIVDGSSDTKAGVALSSMMEKRYNRSRLENQELADDLDNILEHTEHNIDDGLEVFFKDFKESVALFGYPGLYDSEISVKSKIEATKVFKDYVKLYYEQNGFSLPDMYNGLGYSNLLYIVAKIFDFIEKIESEKTSLNVIFIEEPEAHMHPQMQTLFISHVNSFLESKNEQVQLIVSTHSSHIVYGATFDNIRYFSKESINDDTNIEIKDLSVFNKGQSFNDNYKFLKKYLTLHRCDVFFADKLVFVEGATERILLPLFIKKLNSKNSEYPLTSQHIAVIEVGGAYAHIFKELISFLELKTLIITDIDSVDPSNKNRRCEVDINKSLKTSNPILKSWIPRENDIKKLCSLEKEDKTKGTVRVTYQTPMDEKCGRSFEEAMIIDNAKTLFDNQAKFVSLQRLISDCKDEHDLLNKSYAIQQDIDKTDFAFELLINSDYWDNPLYIEEGLEWLQQ